MDTTRTQAPSNRQRPKRTTLDKNSSNVTVASFCDWSQRKEGKSIPSANIKLPNQSATRYSSSLGGTSTSFPNRAPNAARTAKMKQYYSQGVRILNGRVYCRERASLTKGEREIISGIVQNRGDIVPAENVNPNVSNIGEINSHRDAWLIGKQVKLEHPVIKDDDPHVCKCHFEEYHQSKTGCFSCNPAKVYCTTCKLNAVKQISQKSSSLTNLPAPPSSPDGELTHHRLIPPINSEGGAVIIRDIVAKKKTFPDGKDMEKKTKVDVYLPRFDGGDKNQDGVKSDDSPKEADILIIDSLNYNEDENLEEDENFSLQNMLNEIDCVAGENKGELDFKDKLQIQHGIT